MPVTVPVDGAGVGVTVGVLVLSGVAVGVAVLVTVGVGVAWMSPKLAVEVPPRDATVHDLVRHHRTPT